MKKEKVAMVKTAAPTIKPKAIRRQEKPKPPRLFREGDLVSVLSFMKHPELENSSNGIICGYEWGGDNLRRCSNRECWFYYIRAAHSNIGGASCLVAEDQLGRIS